MIIQLCGMSGVGKTTISREVERMAAEFNIPVEVVDGDTYRQTVSKDLGFSKEDRCENIKRLAKIAHTISMSGKVAIISAINPYKTVRQYLRNKYPNIKTVFLDCSVEELIQRDTKGLYRRALLPDGHPDKIENLTGINDPFEKPDKPDLHLYTDCGTVTECVYSIFNLIQNDFARKK